MQREKEGSPKDFFLSFSVASSFLGFFSVPILGSSNDDEEGCIYSSSETKTKKTNKNQN